MVLFCENQEYSLIFVHDFCSMGYEGPIFYKIGSARGVNYLKIRGVGEYHSWKTPLETWIILAKNASCLWFMLFGYT